MARKPARIHRTFTPQFKKDAVAPPAEQLRQLQQRLRAVTEERDILKKALAYFADDQK